MEIQFSEIIRNLNTPIEYEITSNKGSLGKCNLYAENFSENKDKLVLNLRFDNLIKVSKYGVFSCFETFNPIIKVENQSSPNIWAEILTESIDDK